jgi:hypothetical protein
MRNKTRILFFVPAFCALLIVLRLTVLKSVRTSDFSLGTSVGVLIGISIISIIALRRRTAEASR